MDDAAPLRPGGSAGQSAGSALGSAASHGPDGREAGVGDIAMNTGDQQQHQPAMKNIRDRPGGANETPWSLGRAPQPILLLGDPEIGGRRQ